MKVELFNIGSILGSFNIGIRSLQAVEKLTVTKKIDPGSFVV